MRNPLKRYYGRGDLHFVTFSCYRRRPLLGTVRARDQFVKALDEVRRRQAFLLVGYVVMPEHVHLLMSEPAKKNPSKILQVLKQKVSAELSAIRGNAEFWQRRFYDFNVWGNEKFEEKLRYIHGNPVRRGLVGNPRDWVWSSWLFYEGLGSGRISVDSVDDLRFRRQR